MRTPLCRWLRCHWPPAWGGLRRAAIPEFRVLAGANRTACTNRFRYRPPGDQAGSAAVRMVPGASSGWRPNTRGPAGLDLQDRKADSGANHPGTKLVEMPVLGLMLYSGLSRYMASFDPQAERRVKRKAMIPLQYGQRLPQLGNGDPGRHAAGGLLLEKWPSPSLKMAS